MEKVDKKWKHNGMKKVEHQDAENLLGNRKTRLFEVNKLSTAKVSKISCIHISEIFDSWHF